ncbi:glutaredoxin family protein [Bacillus cereus]|nr:glutaredoxin family protein [Bacillus cereus]
MSIKVKMFTKTVCPTCKVAKQQLSFLPVDVDIEEINIETDSVHVGGHLMNADAYLTDILESMATPTFEFESGRIVRGYIEGEIREELGL